MIVLAAVAVMATVITAMQSCRKDNRYHIAIIYSHDKDHLHYTKMNQTLVERFAKAGKNIKVTPLYLRCEHFNEVDEFKECSRMLSETMKENDINMIFTVGDQACYSTLNCGLDIVDSLPVVFGGVIYPNQRLLSRHKNVTGLKDSIDIVENIHISPVLTGFSNTYTLLDRTFLDQKTYDNIRRQIRRDGRIIDNLDWATTFFHLNHLDKDSFSITGFSLRDIGRNTHSQVYRDSLGASNLLLALRRYSHITYIQMKYDTEAIALVRMNGSKPTISAIADGFGIQNGQIVGGYFASSETIAEEMAQYALRIMAGERPDTMTIGISRKDHYIDWMAAKRFGFTKNTLPKGFNIVNMPWTDKYPSLYQAAKYGSASLIIALFIFLYLGLHRERKAKRRAQIKAEQDATMLNLAIQDSQTFQWMRRGDEIEMSHLFWEYYGRNIPRRTTSQDIERCVHTEDRANFKECRRRVEQGESATCEMRADFSGKGHFHWFRMRGQGVVHEDGTFDRAYGMLINIDEYKQREAELNEARRLAEEAQLKESFLANMSHEIRTPLNAIVGFSSLLLQPDADFSDEEKAMFADTIQTNNELLLKLINDILDISRIESGEMDFDIKPCYVSQMIEKAYNTALVQMPKHLEFKLKHDAMDAEVAVDENRIRQVLTNFLTNAGKFTPEGSVTLGWTYDEPHSKVELYVEDTGIGMTDEDRKMVFNRFYKKDEFKQGTGLGLSICKAIVIRLGGSIKVQSEPGKGSRFSIFLKVSEGGVKPINAEDSIRLVTMKK